MFVNQKAQEISYALIRIAPYVKRLDLRQRFERLAFQLLEDVSSQNYESALKTTSTAESLITISKAIYEIEPVNAKVIIGEINQLNSAMRQAIGLDPHSDDLPQLDGIFSKIPSVTANKPDLNNNSAMRQSAENISTRSAQENGSNDNGSGNGSGMASTIRQSAILEKIRQYDNRQVQLKDILSAFPEVSERTMRYDLQKLCNQGLVERIGNGGPGSYYSIRQS